MHRISKGLDLPIAGGPTQVVSDGQPIRSVALVGPDYIGLKPTMAVAEGDRVTTGQLLFTDKKMPGVRFTSPACGTVTALHRGERRSFQSLVISVDGDDAVEFPRHVDPAGIPGDVVRGQLLESGLWTGLRERPFSKVANPQVRPSSIFVQAMDTNPLAADPAVVLGQHDLFFRYGLQVLASLTDGPVHLCKAVDSILPGSDVSGVQVELFEGPHPAGLPGTHIHFLDPVGGDKRVWYINYQDVIAIGHLFVEGRIMTERVVALGGPGFRNPRLVRTRLGASVEDLTTGELAAGNQRVISGSVLSGRRAAGPFAFLGRFHTQVSCVPEGGQRDFLGWLKPGFDKFSVKRVFASALSRDRQYVMTTDTGGSKRAMVPVGSYEAVMPLDILPTFLLRSLITGDTQQARALGCLELDEDDVALLTFVCPGKYEYGPLLRDRLTEIEKEG